MPLDGITAKCLAAELHNQLADARLDRIYQPDRHDILLQLRHGSENLRLILSANPAAPRLHLTSEVRENPSEPPMFCMLLRKHLTGARLISISTPDYERIFQLRFLTTNELGDRLEKTLIIEIMGRHSNIILINHENRIHDAILHIDQSISRVREIMPARIYTLPPNQNKMTPQAVLNKLSAGQELFGPTVQLKTLDQVLLEIFQGFSPQLCHEVLFMAGLDPRYKPMQLDLNQKHQLEQSVLCLMEKIINHQFSPTVFFDQPQASIPIDFHALPLHDFVWQRSIASVSQAMDLYYLESNRQNAFKQKKQSLEKIIKHQLEHARKKYAIHEADRMESENYEQYRHFGELILANLHQVESGKNEMLAIDYYQADQPTIKIPILDNLTPSQNAQRYFRFYAKARSRFESGSRLSSEDRKDIDYWETLQNALATASEPDDLLAVRQEIQAVGLLNDARSSSADRKQSKPETHSNPIQQPGKPGKKNKRQQKASLTNRLNQQKAAGKKAGKGPPKSEALPPRQYTSSDGLTILVGRNNLQNDQLTLKTAQKDDLWLHVQKMPGTHVIIRSNRQAVPDQTLQEAAEIAAWFSRAAAFPEYQRGSLQKVAVDYCPVSHVKKPTGARPGMVIYEHYQTLIVSPKDPQDHAKSSL